jgi:hypothetical protein
VRYEMATTSGSETIASADGRGVAARTKRRRWYCG